MRPNKKIQKHILIDPYYGYKIFNDLEFHPHRNGLGGKQAIMNFDNGHRISVVGGGIGLYGDGITTFEIWRSCDGDVKGHLTKEEVTEEMVELQSLDTRTTPRSKYGF
jgi:hypothetical protein